MVRAGRSDCEVPAINSTEERRKMKASKFTLSIVALVLLSVSAWARDKMKANIQIDETVHVGSTQLAPGAYRMTWTESGSNPELTFSPGKNVIATLPAHAAKLH